MTPEEMLDEAYGMVVQALGHLDVVDPPLTHPAYFFQSDLVIACQKYEDGMAIQEEE